MAAVTPIRRSPSGEPKNPHAHAARERQKQQALEDHLTGLCVSAEGADLLKPALAHAVDLASNLEDRLKRGGPRVQAAHAVSELLLEHLAFLLDMAAYAPDEPAA